MVITSFKYFVIFDESQGKVVDKEMLEIGLKKYLGTTKVNSSSDKVKMSYYYMF